MFAGDDPVIGSVSPNQTLHGETSAIIWAEDVTTTGTIDMVWAVITPPGLDPSQASSPGTDLPLTELHPISEVRYEATYTGFSAPGTYEVGIYGRDAPEEDGIENISLPYHTRVYQEGACSFLVDPSSVRSFEMFPRAVDLQITGTDTRFVQGETTVRFDPPSITVFGEPKVLNSEELEAVAVIKKGAVSGAYDVIVETDGQGCMVRGGLLIE
jgi:hypothetical protein